MEHLIPLFTRLLTMALTALPVMAAVLAVRLLLRRAPRKFAYLLWAVVAFRLLCPVSLDSPVGLGQPYAVQRQVTAAANRYLAPTRTLFESAEGYQAAVDHGREPIDGGAEDYVVTAPDGVSEPATLGSEALPVAAGVWLAGMAAIAAVSVVSYLRLRRRLSTAVRLEGNVWQSEAAETPFVLGWLRPKIYIPFHLTEEERRYVLLHERTHLRRGDQWWKLLGFALMTVYWWDPAVWLCWVLFCRDMEMSCDEAVLRHLGTDIKGDYSRSLVRFAAPGGFPALAFGESDAVRRVKHVLNWKKATPRVAFLAGTAVALALIVCGTDADGGSWVKLSGMTQMRIGPGVAAECRLEEPIQAWALFQEVYEEGKLSSSELRLSGNARGGWTGQWFSMKLSISANDGGTVTCVYEGDNTGAEWTVDLPKDSYTGSGAMAGDGSGQEEYALTGNDSVILGSWLFSTRADGSITAWHRDLPLTETNDTVVQFRLMTSTDPEEDFLARGDLAETLFALRTDSVTDVDGTRALLEAMGVGELGPYIVSWNDGPNGRALHVNFENAPADADETGLSDVIDGKMLSCENLLFALIGDAEQVDWSYPRIVEGGVNRITVYNSCEAADLYARERGYKDIKALGRTVQGIREVTQYYPWAEQPGIPDPQPMETAVWFAPEDIHDIESAELLWWDGQRAKLHRAEDAAWIEKTLSGAKEISAPACPFSSVLYLQRSDGVLGKIMPAEDECGNFLSDGKYYRVEDAGGYGWTFYSQFGLDPRELMQYSRPGMAVTTANGDSIGACWFAEGEAAPALTDLTPLLAGEDTALTLELSGGDDTMVVREAYYGPEGAEVRRGNYTLVRDADGAFVLPVTRRDPEQTEQAVYTIPWEGGTMMFRVIFPSLNGQPLEGQPFRDILGYDGIIRVKTDSVGWSTRTYYAVENGKVFQIAESFGYDGNQDFSVDLDGDGMKELAANVQYGGDGHETVYVFQRTGDAVRRGHLDLSGLPEHDDWGVNSTSAKFDPVDEVFRVRYSLKNSREYGTAEFRGLEKIVFE